MNDTIVEISTCIAMVVVVLVGVGLYKLYMLSQMKELKSFVAWSVIGGYHPTCSRYSFLSDLWDAVLIAQHELNIPKEYRIDEKEDRELCHKIIEAYQVDIARKFFLDELTLIKSKYAASGKDYFMLALHNFLSKRQCYSEVAGHAMHKEQLEYKKYGEWNGAIYDATYLLSDFGLLYHKLLYITFCYLKNSRVFNPENRPDWEAHVENGIKKVLDTKQLGVSRP